MGKNRKQSGDFWGGSSDVTEEKDKKVTDAELDEKRQRSGFDWRWLLLAGVTIAVIVTAVVLNLSKTHNGDNASNIAGSIDIDNGDTKINWSRYTTTEVALGDLTGDTYTITASGTYHLTGEYAGTIVVKADNNEGQVRLILDGATIKSANGPAIACLSGDDLVIELVGDNYLTDGKAYSSDYDADVDGAIYSKADLSFTGDGTLELVANYQDAIVGKDDLKFNSGTYTITAADDAVRGKDSIYIVDGDFTVNAAADAFKATNETEGTKGFILIENGKLAIKAGGKGIKAINSILIYGGDFNVESTDDAIHSNNYVGIVDGTLALASGDDGIHADARLIIEGGKLTITKSYEGIEAQKISFNGGDISIMSNDDGINAGGGADASATNRVGAGAFDADENCELAINGGNVYVNAAGDGVDSNGYLYFNGGTVIVDGPTNNGNGSLDAGSGIIMNGGTVVAVGASGMAESLGTASTVRSVSVYFSSTLAKGTEVTIKDAGGSTIISHTSAKSFSHLTAGTSKFLAGETYTIYVNGEKYQDFTVSDIVTVVGNSNNGFQNMNGAGGAVRGQMR